MESREIEQAKDNVIKVLIDSGGSEWELSEQDIKDVNDVVVAFEKCQKQNKQLLEEIERLKEQLHQALNVNGSIRNMLCNEIELRAESDNKVDEYCHKIEGLEIHITQLQSELKYKVGL